jgi:hypothetical protein
VQAVGAPLAIPFTRVGLAPLRVMGAVCTPFAKGRPLGVGEGWRRTGMASRWRGEGGGTREGGGDGSDVGWGWEVGGVRYELM